VGLGASLEHPTGLVLRGEAASPEARSEIRNLLEEFIDKEFKQLQD